MRITYPPLDIVIYKYVVVDQYIRICFLEEFQIFQCNQLLEHPCPTCSIDDIQAFLPKFNSRVSWEEIKICSPGIVVLN